MGVGVLQRYCRAVDILDCRRVLHCGLTVVILYVTVIQLVLETAVYIVDMELVIKLIKLIKFYI